MTYYGCCKVQIEKNKITTQPLFSDTLALVGAVQAAIAESMALLEKDGELDGQDLQVSNLALNPEILASSPKLVLKLRIVLARLLFCPSAKDVAEFPSDDSRMEVLTQLVDADPFLGQLAELKVQHSLVDLPAVKKEREEWKSKVLTVP